MITKILSTIPYFAMLGLSNSQTTDGGLSNSQTTEGYYYYDSGEDNSTDALTTSAHAVINATTTSAHAVINATTTAAHAVINATTTAAHAVINATTTSTTMPLSSNYTQEHNSTFNNGTANENDDNVDITGEIVVPGIIVTIMVITALCSIFCFGKAITQSCLSCKQKMFPNAQKKTPQPDVEEVTYNLLNAKVDILQKKETAKETTLNSPAM